MKRDEIEDRLGADLAGNPYPKGAVDWFAYRSACYQQASAAYNAKIARLSTLNTRLIRWAILPGVVIMTITTIARLVLEFSR